jgi:hypothetical protein
MHNGFKDEGKEGIASSGRRRIRGLAAAQILVTVMMVTYNLRTILKFLRDKLESEAEPGRIVPTPRMRRRDALWDNPYTKTKAVDSILNIAARGELESPYEHRPISPATPPRGTHPPHTEEFHAPETRALSVFKHYITQPARERGSV